MRTFGEEKIEYLEFKLKDDETIYKIPLAASIPYGILDKMDGAEDDDRFRVQVEMLRKYMGDVVDDLSAGILSDIIVAWAEESRDEGASVGES